MPARDSSYTRIAIVLHWLIAAGVLAQLALGWWMVDLPKSPPGVRAYWFNVHKSIGITLGLLVAARVLWRLAHRPPALPATLPRWQRIAAGASHAGLYACMMLMPVTGFLGSSFTRYPIRYFGYTLPQWGWQSPALKALMSALHHGTVIVFVALIAVHVAAALKHALLDRDAVLARMWAWPRGS